MVIRGPTLDERPLTVHPYADGRDPGRTEATLHNKLALGHIGNGIPLPRVRSAVIA